MDGKRKIELSKRPRTIDEKLHDLLHQVRVLNGIGQLDSRFKSIISNKENMLFLAEKLEALNAAKREQFESLDTEDKIEFLLPTSRPRASAPALAPGGAPASANGPFTKREMELFDEIAKYERDLKKSIASDAPEELIRLELSSYNGAVGSLRNSIEKRGLNPDELGVPKLIVIPRGGRKCRKCGRPKRM